MAAVDYCIGAMIAAELEYVGDQSITKVYVPRRVLLEGIPVEDLRAYVEERERASG